MNTLRFIAGVLAVASLLMTVLYVRDRRQRAPGLLLSIGLICNIVGPLFHDSALEMAFLVISTVFVVASLILAIYSQRARTD